MATPLEILQEAFDDLNSAWEGSLQDYILRVFIRNHILVAKNIKVDSALCLGLGSLVDVAPKQEPSSPRKRPSIPVSSDPGSSDEEYEEVQGHALKLTDIFSGSRNFEGSLYQLIVFESVVKHLKEKFEIDNMRFQDPKFSETDIAFLEGRGYKVLPYPDDLRGMKQDPSLPLDINVLSIMSKTTFLFTPFLDLPVIAELITTTHPSLYLSHNPFTDLASIMLLPRNAVSFQEFAMSRNYRNLRVLGWNGFGFSLPLPTDRSDKVQARFEKNIGGWERDQEISQKMWDGMFERDTQLAIKRSAFGMPDSESMSSEDTVDTESDDEGEPVGEETFWGETAEEDTAEEDTGEKDTGGEGTAIEEAEVQELVDRTRELEMSEAIDRAINQANQGSRYRA